MDQKTLAQFLDTAASRAEMIDRIPATAKQCWFLAKLIIDAGSDASEFITNTSRILTKREASSMISMYLNN